MAYTLVHLPWLPGESNIVTMDRCLSAREEVIKILKTNLSQAHNRVKATCWQT